MVRITTLTKKFSGVESISAKPILFIGFSLLASVFFSCKEIGPSINFSNNGNDTTGTGVDSNQQKTVLMEDFTATDCPNCPKARNDIDNLLSAYPGRIEVVEVHEGILSHPLLSGDPALKTTDGESLATLLGGPPYWPVGAIDRKAYEISPGTFAVLVDHGLWPTYVPEELSDSVIKVKIGLGLSYNVGARQLTGSVTVDFNETITDPLNITVLITESGIVAAQVDGLVIDSNYVHRDVLRDIITNYQGDPVTGTKTQGSTWTYNLAPYDVSTEWNADSCRIIAFVSESAGSFDVLQCIGKPLK